MAKILRGRISGLYGMESHYVEELEAWARRWETWAGIPSKIHDPRWLLRWAKRLQCLAEQKDRARRHKSAHRQADHDRDAARTARREQRAFAERN